MKTKVHKLRGMQRSLVRVSVSDFGEENLSLLRKIGMDKKTLIVYFYADTLHRREIIIYPYVGYYKREERPHQLESESTTDFYARLAVFHVETICNDARKELWLIEREKIARKRKSKVRELRRLSSHVRWKVWFNYEKYTNSVLCAKRVAEEINNNKELNCSAVVIKPNPGWAAGVTMYCQKSDQLNIKAKVSEVRRDFVAEIRNNRFRKENPEAWQHYHMSLK